MAGSECFAMDLADIKPPVIEDKVDDLIQLFIQMRAVVRDNGHADDGQLCAVLGVRFGDRGVKAIAQSLDEALDNAALAFQRADGVQMKMNC